MVRILIADDHRIFRDGLRRLLEVEPDFEIVGEASDGRDAIAQVRSIEPDVLLLDLSMPGVDGLEALKGIAERPGATRTLLLTAAIEKPELVTALQLGARGLVLKDSATSVLLTGIRSVMRGEYWVGRESVPTLVDALRPLIAAEPDKPRNAFGLTDREREIVAAVVAALGNKEIATKLSITEKTVKHHLTNIFDKLGVSTRLELALFAIHHDLQLPDLDAAS
jgi:two-component system, NarL family, nitrate/nitrite response regulator NarL